MDCVNQTLRVFRKGKLDALELQDAFRQNGHGLCAHQKAGYQKVIVVTHRPVVEDGWRNDFDLIFGEGDNRAFLKKTVSIRIRPFTMRQWMHATMQT